jgi:4-amino-4-deoxy-L-arabinose transferase-like glycosyltransferase
MKPVRLPASATNALPRWGLFALCLLYILPGLVGRDPWKEDAAGFGVMWTMAHGGLNDWLWPHIVGLPMPEQGPLAFWIGALFIKLFGWLLGDFMAARMATIVFFLIGALSVWYATYLLGRRAEAQPLKLAFGGQPEPRDYGRTLADGALLIYLGSLGLLMHSHLTMPGALQISLVAFAMYAAARFFESWSVASAAVLGLGLGALILTRGWVLPLALVAGLAALTATRERRMLARLAGITLPLALLLVFGWVALCNVVRPFNSSPFDAWMGWNARQIGLPTTESVGYFIRTGIWFSWPAWPFAGWAVYAWRRQSNALHVGLPLAFFIPAAILVLLSPVSEEVLLLPWLPPLAILAAFGLPTMKRGAINAVDWYSVMTLTTAAFAIWLYWLATQTGWPPALAKAAFRLVPGFKPEFHPFAVVFAAAASVAWIFIVQWRISRRPSVLWRAVVLSSGGVILCWLLLMTLALPWADYRKSYAAVARQLGQQVPQGASCVDSNLGPAQRASFAYFGHVPFAQFDGKQCDWLLLQDNVRAKKNDARPLAPGGGEWQLQWEGGRASDRDERFRLYRRIR